VSANQPRRRRAALPELSQIESLINNARELRLALVKLSAYETLAEPAREALGALTKASAALERITELVTQSQAKRRRRPQGPANQPSLPNLERDSASSS
jgi:hypothetical protein